MAVTHPFLDGNDRTARIMMNSEIFAAAESRIVIPTNFTEHYLGGLRRLSTTDDPSVYIKALDRAQAYTAAVDYSDLDATVHLLEETHAFNNPDENLRLIMPECGPTGANTQMRTQAITTTDLGWSGGSTGADTRHQGNERGAGIVFSRWC